MALFMLIFKRYMVHQIAHWADPLYLGDYPKEMKDQIKKLSLNEGHTKSRLPEFTEEEKIMINGTLDFYSLQMYSSRIVTSSEPLKCKIFNVTVKCVT